LLSSFSDYALQGWGQTDDAIASFDMALGIKPDFRVCYREQDILVGLRGWREFRNRTAMARRVWWQQVGSQVAASPP